MIFIVPVQPIISKLKKSQGEFQVLFIYLFLETLKFICNLKINIIHVKCPKRKIK